MSVFSRCLPGASSEHDFSYQLLEDYSGDSAGRDDAIEPLSAKVDRTVRQLFFLAAYNGNVVLAESLCQSGHSPNFQAKSLLDFPEVLLGDELTKEMKMGMSPLHLAVLQDKKKMIKFLIATKKVDVDPKNSLGATPLHLAIARGFLPIAHYLIKAGGSVNHRDQQGRTPWYMASRLVHVNFAAKPVSADTSEGRKVQRIRYNMMRMLVFYGADTGIRFGALKQTAAEVIVDDLDKRPTLLKTAFCRNMLLISAACEKMLLETIGHLFPMEEISTEEKGKPKTISQTHKVVQLVFGYYFDDFTVSLYELEQEKKCNVVFSHLRLDDLMQPDKMGFLVKGALAPK